MDANNSAEIEKIKTGISGFDIISKGGLPKGRTTLVSGTSGSAKTVLAVQFIAEGIQQFGESGVFVTFEETPNDIRRNMLGLGWDIKKWEEQGKWAFVDGTPNPGEDAIFTGTYDLSALTVRIKNQIEKIGATRISLDSLGAVFTQFDDASTIRKELFQISSILKSMGITTIMTAERIQDYGDISRYGVEEFVSDNVLILRNVLQDEKRRRTLEILKFRGAVHHKGEYPFTIIPDEGLRAIPLSGIDLVHKSSNMRTTSGNQELDNMCHGGFLRDSVILVSGATGTGKTLLVTSFIGGGVKFNEKCLLFAFEESREQIFRNASGWGYDFDKMEKEGSLKVVCKYPETQNLEEHLFEIQRIIEEYKPDRVAVDSISALERVSSRRGFREFVIGLTSFLKKYMISGLLTSTTTSLLGGSSITETNISTITDSIILLRYVEVFGEMRRGLTVLKMRGSMHDKSIREFNIDETGMHIGNPFRNVTGILTGAPQHINQIALERESSLFPHEELND